MTCSYEDVQIKSELRDDDDARNVLNCLRLIMGSDKRPFFSCLYLQTTQYHQCVYQVQGWSRKKMTRRERSTQKLVTHGKMK
ncbi:unnamed protein product [Allacma fusca]|uniref:Uncharacterized protein n=1 Tax=Allacma fusca TaxID=39272 RepID=A0A8J2L4Z7_9HEXA|nr:unnamed protein product [Allacma fusca]